MDDAADPVEMPVEHDVGFGVRRGIQLSLHDAVTQIDQHHVIRGELVVGYTAGLYGYEAACAVDARDVSERGDNETLVIEFPVCLVDGSSQCLQFHGDSTIRRLAIQCLAYNSLSMGSSLPPS